MTDDDMTDDRERIAALFRHAAGDPPPGFDHDVVVRRSRQVTARRRSAVLGSAMALLVVVGVGVVVNRPTGESTAAAPAAERAEDAAGAAADAPFAASEPGSDLRPGEPLEGRAPLGPGTTPCEQRQDPQLRVLLDGVLPEVATSAQAAVTDECRSGGTREVNLQVVDGNAAGLLTVAAYPAGEPYLVASDGAAATADTASGGTVVVRSAGDGPGAPVPFAGRLADIAAALAPFL